MSKPPVSTLPGQARFIKIGNPFKTIGDAIKSGASATIGFFEDAVNILVDTAQGVFRFVVDTVEKVAEFVEAVVEKVVESIKQFIEFLQFLFDWDDILDTQRYLKRTINAGLDSAKQLAVNAKPHVKAFVDDLQDGVEDGMNQLVKTLGGKPSEVEGSGFEIPEALEWFLSKFLGGSKSSDSETTPDSGSGDSPLANFVRQMLEAFEDAVGAGLRVSEGVLDSIQALLENPRQPEVALITIIEAFRDAIIQSLDAVENVALGLLDVVGAAIDFFKDLLNAEIRIPFISDLLDFIGVGKLTAMNLATLVLAIPVTVTAKLVTGQNLFTNATPVPLALSNQKESTLAFARVTSESPVSFTSADSSNDSGSTGKTASSQNISDLEKDVESASKDLKLTIIVTVADTVNHVINGILDLFDVPGPDKEPTILNILTPLQALEVSSIVLSFVSWGCSYPAQFEKDAGGIPKKEEDRRERAAIILEITLWSYRGAKLILDAAVMSKQGIQRMRRIETIPNVVWALLSFIDISLAVAFVIVADEGAPITGADLSNEIFSALPNIACFARSIEADIFTEVLIHLGLIATDAAAALVTGVTGGILMSEASKALKKANKALEEAKAVA
ncbi:MAG: hypothetical protein AAF215_26790 [Cyanobacteria bacterium P01_A01_bin.123]